VTVVSVGALSYSRQPYQDLDSQIGIHLRLTATAEMHTLNAIPDSKVVQLHWFPDGTKLLAPVPHVESVLADSIRVPLLTPDT
jgi:hypothetical protein